MNYTFLRQGDHLPSVGVLQKLLNRAGAKLDPDGSFGPITVAAVRKFQKAKHLNPDGIVGERTWERLIEGVNIPIFDCVDIYDSVQREEALAKAKVLREKRKVAEANKVAKEAAKMADSYESEVDDIRTVGGNPFVIGGMSNGVDQAISMIRLVARQAFLLRFHGHGYPGSAGIASGAGGPKEFNRIKVPSIPQLDRILRLLRPIFGPYGAVQFMHCETGRGPEGRQLLHSLASIFGVPTTAGILRQLGGGETTFRFEGPTYTAVPNGGSLKEWCRALPDFPT